MTPLDLAYLEISNAAGCIALDYQHPSAMTKVLRHLVAVLEGSDEPSEYEPPDMRAEPGVGYPPDLKKLLWQVSDAAEDIAYGRAPGSTLHLPLNALVEAWQEDSTWRSWLET